MSSARLSSSEKKKLQRMIDKTAAASTEFYKAQDELYNWCDQKYGYGPGDIDCDEIIDGVLGGCGQSNGMPAVKFHNAMIN